MRDGRITKLMLVARGVRGLDAWQVNSNRSPTGRRPGSLKGVSSPDPGEARKVSFAGSITGPDSRTPCPVRIAWLCSLPGTCYITPPRPVL